MYVFRVVVFWFVFTLRSTCLGSTSLLMAWRQWSLPRVLAKTLYNLQGSFPNPSVYSSVWRSCPWFTATGTTTSLLRVKLWSWNARVTLMKLKLSWAGSWLTMHLGGNKNLPRKLQPRKSEAGCEKGGKGPHCPLKIFYDIREKIKSSSKYYFFLEDIYCKENKLSPQSIFLSTRYFPPNISF